MSTSARARITRLLVTSGTLVAVTVALAGCGSPESQPAAVNTAAPADAGGALDLTGSCPETVVMQQDWQPEAEHGAMYSLVGEDYVIDAEAKSVSGSLIAQGVDTGVDIEVRPGGPNVNFQPVPALMYLDPEILIGAVNSDVAIVAAADQPTVAVTSQLTWSPQILMWDPESHDGASTIPEAAAGGAPVVTAGDVIPTLLVSKGIIEASQMDLSYEGTPQRFVSDPTILQQGFVTAEPYIYEEEISEWAKPVGYQLLSELGYSIYPEPLAVRPETIEEYGDCLAKLVPIMQQAQIDFLAEPDDTVALILELVEAYQTGWTYSQGVADYSVEQQKALGIVTDDPATGVFGHLDPERMESIVADFVPILVESGSISASDAEQISAESLYTNEFIDMDISME
ncbi:hypothetical protein [Microbacterium sp. dk485]|uniref:hypothetical protein n=1 Tax=Microbacterium sp. dk485 TaxID=2560021 RepID=UPI001ADDA1DE|nr:hypothetical protein [Microbacterium sp. dk485]